MADILASAKAYAKLLDTEYQIILGKKNKNILLKISFEEMHFFHLAGLHYLKDRMRHFNESRDVIFQKILNGTITQTQLESSQFYQQIKDRIEYLAFLEEIMDSNKTVFKYNPKLETFSAIQADFLLKNEIRSLPPHSPTLPKKLPLDRNKNPVYIKNDKSLPIKAAGNLSVC